MKSLIFFHASWCSPCKVKEREVIDPLLEKYGDEKIIKIDAWNNPCVTERFGVGKLPALLFCDPKSYDYQRVDHMTLEELEELLHD